MVKTKKELIEEIIETWKLIKKAEIKNQKRLKKILPKMAKKEIIEILNDEQLKFYNITS